MEQDVKTQVVYQKHEVRAREDERGSEYLIPGWTVDNNRPCMVR